MKGRIRYGPEPAPHTASVWPKSSRLFSMPQYLAASNRPPMPSVLLMRKRGSPRPAPPHLPWSRLFTNRGTKRMLSKPFAMTTWNGSGMATLQPFATGLCAPPGGGAPRLPRGVRRAGFYGWRVRPGGEERRLAAEGPGQGPATTERQGQDGHPEECSAALNVRSEER